MDKELVRGTNWILIGVSIILFSAFSVKKIGFNMAGSGYAIILEFKDIKIEDIGLLGLEVIGVIVAPVNKVKLPTDRAAIKVAEILAGTKKNRYKKESSDQSEHL